MKEFHFPRSNDGSIANKTPFSKSVDLYDHFPPGARVRWIIDRIRHSRGGQGQIINIQDLFPSGGVKNEPRLSFVRQI